MQFQKQLRCIHSIRTASSSQHFVATTLFKKKKSNKSSKSSTKLCIMIWKFFSTCRSTAGEIMCNQSEFTTGRLQLSYKQRLKQITVALLAHMRGHKRTKILGFLVLAVVCSGFHGFMNLHKALSILLNGEKKKVFLFFFGHKLRVFPTTQFLCLPMCIHAISRTTRGSWETYGPIALLFRRKKPCALLSFSIAR